MYGPDDWLMVQLRSGMGGGGGGGGFQSLDYGFRQNPSTGKCHLTPPTIPMGCGRKILEELHIQLATYAGLMILQTLAALAAACFAGYSFFYWLEKEVIVIPEDEVSNLIVLEPESSTSVVTGASGYYGEGPNSGSGFYPGGGGGGEYLQGGSRGPSYMGGGGSGSRGPSYMGGGSGSGSYRTPTNMPTGYYPGLVASNGTQKTAGGSGGGGASGMGGVGVGVPPGTMQTINGVPPPPGSGQMGLAGVPTTAGNEANQVGSNFQD